MTHIRQPNPLHKKNAFKIIYCILLLIYLTNNPSDVHEFLILIY